MPPGGHRPGAGAPRGNFNGLTSGGNSVRLRMLLFVMRDYPDQHALAHIIARAGYLPLDPLDRRMRLAAYRFAWHWFFVDRDEAFARYANPNPPPNLLNPSDCAKCNSIKLNQLNQTSESAADPSPPPPRFAQDKNP